MKLGGMRGRMNGWTEDEAEAYSNILSHHFYRYSEETTENCKLGQSGVPVET
jgi:hypothetical protein